MFVEFIALGISAGLLAGMFGIGGGIVIVPVLVLVFNFAMQEASGTSLAALLLPAGFMALLQYKRAGLLNIKVSALIAFGIFIGSALGATIALDIDAFLLRQIYGVFLLWVGYIFSRPLRVSVAVQRSVQSNILVEPLQAKLYIYLLIGLLAGVSAGMFGIGGGVIITAILIGLLKVPAKQAVVISLAALFLPVGLPGVLLYYKSGFINIQAAILLAVGIELGSAISARIALKLKSNIIKRLYGIFVILMGIYFIFQKYIHTIV
jgi:uncharacterized membrane protein YfcA